MVFGSSALGPHGRVQPDTVGTAVLRAIRIIQPPQRRERFRGGKKSRVQVLGLGTAITPVLQVDFEEAVEARFAAPLGGFRAYVPVLHPSACRDDVA